MEKEKIYTEVNQFIKMRLIDNVGQMLQCQNYYLSFVIMAIGIEFLGKCIDKEETDWYNHKNGNSRFNNAIRTLKSLRKYEELIPRDKHFLYHNLRNGFAHSLLPNGTLVLASPGDVDSNRMPLEHLKIVKNEHGKECVILRCDILYKDFSEACREVIEEWTFDDDNKMNKPILAHNYN